MLLTDVGLLSHLVAAIGFGLLAVAVALRPQQNGASPWLAGAALATSIWATVFVVAAQFGGPYYFWLSIAETVRSAAWIVFLVALLRVSWRLDDRLRSSFLIAGAIGFLTTLQLLLDVLDKGETVMPAAPVLGPIFVVTRLIAAIGGLVLLHNLYSNAAPASQAGIRLLGIGLAGFFGYDLNLYTLQFLLGGMSSDLFNIRGTVDALVVPLLLLSTRQTWVARVQVSRQVAFHTLSMSIIGGYLIVMALLAYALRLVGGDWGRLLQITFLSATILLGAVVIFSPRFRAALRVAIAKNFFTYKYDYRQEWLRFIATVSRADATIGGLSERVVEAVCTVVDSPGGALFTPADDGSFDMAAQWNFRDFTGTRVGTGSGVGLFLAEAQRIVDLDEWRDGRGDYGSLGLPDWSNDRRAWLLVPLMHLEHFAGFIVVQRTVAKRSLNWEDFDLLRTLGRQAASYIAEASTQAALDEAGKFDEFNRRFAFIMHDLKNLVSQLSLVARNAERHADNPAFRADMVRTLQGSVGKMNDLLARLAQRNPGRSDVWRRVDLGDLLRDVVAAKHRQFPGLELSVADSLSVAGDPAQLEQLFAHLIQNAIDASDASSAITVRARAVDDQAKIDIVDRGIGMSPAFVRSELFKPFSSTKAGGFGIGAYEAREIARGAGGRLDVLSREGVGTTFTVQLPLRGAVAEHAPARAAE